MHSESETKTSRALYLDRDSQCVRTSEGHCYKLIRISDVTGGS